MTRMLTISRKSAIYWKLCPVGLNHQNSLVFQAQLSYFNLGQDEPDKLLKRLAQALSLLKNSLDLNTGMSESIVRCSHYVTNLKNDRKKTQCLMSFRI